MHALKVWAAQGCTTMTRAPHGLIIGSCVLLLYKGRLLGSPRAKSQGSTTKDHHEIHDSSTFERYLHDKYGGRVAPLSAHKAAREVPRQ